MMAIRDPELQIFLFAPYNPGRFCFLHISFHKYFLKLVPLVPENVETK